MIAADRALRRLKAVWMIPGAFSPPDLLAGSRIAFHIRSEPAGLCTGDGRLGRDAGDAPLDDTTEAGSVPGTTRRRGIDVGVRHLNKMKVHLSFPPLGWFRFVPRRRVVDRVSLHRHPRCRGGGREHRFGAGELAPSNLKSQRLKSSIPLRETTMHMKIRLSHEVQVRSDKGCYYRRSCRGIACTTL
nr:hypothetical protein CFP56_09883 [Quercus suber]